MLDQIRAKRDELYAIAAKHKAEKLWVFGSCARKEERPDSDVDFLVNFASGATLFGMADLQGEFQALLKRPIDLVTEKSLKHDSFGSRVRTERVTI